MMYKILAAFLAACFLFPAQASAQLLSERVEGNKRVCRYESSGLPTNARPLDAPVLNSDTGAIARRDAPRPREAEREVRLEFWQLCPAIPPAELNRPAAIPPLAHLRDKYRREGHLFCIYAYADRTYEVDRGSSLTCPYTPIGATGVPADENRYRRSQ
jgi:hypothetical protein